MGTVLVFVIYSFKMTVILCTIHKLSENLKETAREDRGDGDVPNTRVDYSLYS